MDTRRTLGVLATQYVTDRRKRGEIEETTARTVRQHLDGLVESFGQRPLNQYGRRAVERWMETTGHLAPSTRALRLGSVRGFSEWLLVNGHASNLATAGMTGPRRKRRVSRDVGQDEFARLMANATRRRTRLIMLLMYALGLRCVEVSRLLVDDWDPVQAELIVRGKGSHERAIPVPSAVAVLLGRYIAEERLAGGPLIRSELNPAKGISPHRVSGLVRKVFIDSGVKQRSFDGRSAHALRAAAASDLVDDTGDPRLAQQLLGHANLATTSVYMRRVTQKRLRDALENRWAA